jgi:putative peptide zinc metalloprotease protein
VQITRQHYRGRRWHVVRDPSSNQFYRLNAVAHEFVGLFDGRRTVEELWRHGLHKHADAALTQNEVLQLLSQLYQANLVAGDIQPETDQLLKRGRERVAKKAKAQAIGLMYFKVRLFNPDWLLSVVEPVMRPLLSRFGLIAWAVLLIAALASVVPHWEQLRGQFSQSVAPSNWPWLLAVFVVLKLIHESGHGLICKRFGGHVPEFGAMMLVLIPAPYVDASSTWAFPSKWKRIAVGAGGMIFELAVAAAATFAWIATLDRPDSLIHQLAFNAMFTASVSTVLFNANPLMRFDGYYILSDLLEIPNLQPRSFALLKFLFQRHVYRINQAQPPTTDPSEAAQLLAYGVLSLAYRVFLFISITLYVMGQMFAIGVILAVWTAAMWFLLPFGQFTHWLATSDHLTHSRARAVGVSVAMAAVVAVAIGVVPFPDRRRAPGIVESQESSTLFFGTDGLVARALVAPGDPVVQGQPLIELESPRLMSQLRLARAQLDEAKVMERRAVASSPAEAIIAQRHVETMREQVRMLEDRERRLTLFAPQDGVVVGADPRELVGALVREGQQALEILDPKRTRVTATLPQTEGLWLYELPAADYTVELRPASDVSRVISARMDRVFDAGGRDLPHAALGFAGGGTIQTDASREDGTAATKPVFKAWITIPGVSDDGEAAHASLTRPGERVTIRFTLPDKPLAAQWVDRLRKLLQGRARI